MLAAQLLTSEKRKNVACAAWDVPTAEAVEVAVAIVDAKVKNVADTIKTT